MIDFPADYKIRTERDFFSDCLVYERLEDFKKHLSHACIDMDWKYDGQTVDCMFAGKYHLWRVYDIDGVKKYKLRSGLNTFFVERKDHAQMIDDLFRKRNTPLMHIKYALYSMVKPDKNFDLFARAVLAVQELPYNLKMCKLNKTR